MKELNSFIIYLLFTFRGECNNLAILVYNKKGVYPVFEK